MEKIFDQLIGKLQWAFGASGFMLAATTLISANTMFATWLNKALPSWLAILVPLLSFGLAVVIMRLVDGSLAPSMKVALAYLVGPPHVKARLREKMKGVWVPIVLFAFFVFSISAGFTFLSGYVISDSALSDKEPVNAQNEIVENQRIAATQFSQANLVAKSAVADAEARLEKAKRDYDTAVKQAVSNEGSSFKEAYYTRFTWLSGSPKHKKAMQRVNDTKKEYKSYISEAQKNLRQAEAAATSVGTKGALASVETMENISEAGMSVVDNHNRRVRVFTKNLWIIDGVFAFLFLACGFILARTDNLLPSISLDDVVSDAVSKRYKDFIHYASQKLGGETGYSRPDDRYEEEESYEEVEGVDEEAPLEENQAEWDVNDISKIRTQASVYLKRAYSSETEAARKRNMDKVQGWLTELDQAGVKYRINGDKIEWL